MPWSPDTRLRKVMQILFVLLTVPLRLPISETRLYNCEKLGLNGKAIWRLSEWRTDFDISQTMQPLSVPDCGLINTMVRNRDKESLLCLPEFLLQNR